ncbi:hypothetical protein [Acidithiobacillus sp.]
MRTAKFVLLTSDYLITIVLFLVSWIVYHHSIFTSMVVAGFGFFGLTFSGFLAAKTSVEYEIMREKQALDKETPDHE